MTGSTRAAGNALVDEYDKNSPAQQLLPRLTDPGVLARWLALPGIVQRTKSYWAIPCPKKCGGPFCSMRWVEKQRAILFYCPTCRRGGNALHVIAFARGLHIVHDFPKVLREAERIAIATERKARQEVRATTN